MAGPRAAWTLARGFDRWCGLHGGEKHQFVPARYHDNHAVRPPARMQDGYHLTEDLADRAIEFLGDLRAVDADKPFFLYFATGACHSPHQPPAKWREHYRGRLGLGWDAWRGAGFVRPVGAGRLAGRAHASAGACVGAALGAPAGGGLGGAGASLAGFAWFRSA